MLSELRRRKLTKLFRMYDANHNGVIERTDYERIGARLAAASGYVPGTSGYDQLFTSTVSGWASLQQMADRDGDGRVSLDDFLGSYEQLLGVKDVIRSIAQASLQAIDRDGDGKISRQEHLLSSRAYGISDVDAVAAFERLDRDGDGYIDNEEYLADVDEFFYSEDPNARGNWLVGDIAGVD